MKAFDIYCPEVRCARHTMIAKSEEAAIKSFKRIYPQAVTVFATEDEEPEGMAATWINLAKSVEAV